jgi:integrase
MESQEDLALWAAFKLHYGTASKTLKTQAQLALEDYCDAEGDLEETKGGWGHLAPATVRKRLNCLSKMGVDVKGHRPKLDNGLKWWLNDNAKATLLASPEVPDLMKRWIGWTTATGLRVEENLRLDTRKNLDLVRREVTVPGLKTHGSQATLPLSQAAVEALGSGWGHVPFAIHLRALQRMWDDCKAILGETEDHTCTLKALRRNAARHLHSDLGMPLDMVRQYLRHTDIDTTMGYLHLTGGYRTNEMRRYLDGRDQ